MVVTIICTIVTITAMATATGIIIKEFNESMCEVLGAIFNVEQIKAKCEEAAKNGEGFVDISEAIK